VVAFTEKCRDAESLPGPSLLGLLALAHGGCQRAAGVAQFLGAIDQLEGRLARRLGIALLGGTRDLLERAPDLAHGRDELVALVGEILRRFQVLELLPQVPKLLRELVELPGQLPVRRALGGLEGGPHLLAEGADAFAQRGEVVPKRRVLAVVAAARDDAQDGQGDGG
jgi:hypothetical protein